MICNILKLPKLLIIFSVYHIKIVQIDNVYTIYTPASTCMYIKQLMHLQNMMKIFIQLIGWAMSWIHNIMSDLYWMIRLACQTDDRYRSNLLMHSLCKPCRTLSCSTQWLSLYGSWKVILLSHKSSFLTLYKYMSDLVWEKTREIFNVIWYSLNLYSSIGLN